MLPQNIEAEQAVLGSLLIDVRAIERIAAFLRPEDFYLPVNAEIYRGMLALYERDMPSDIVTLSDHLQARDRLDDMGGAAYLASLATIVPTSINVEYYARIVERLAVLRRLVDAGNRIAAIGYDERFEADAALEEAEKVLFDISRLRVTRDFVPIANVLTELVEKLDHIHSHDSEITGITTGFIDLDKLTSGFQRSDLLILAARPSMGKTALALNVAHSVAVKAGLPVGIFSVEMSAEQLAQRLLSLQSQVDSQKLRSGRMSDLDWARLTEAVGVLSESPIFVDDTPALSIVEMRSKARRLHSEQGLGLLIIDYLQLMQGASSSENRVQEISAISRSLKAVARELDVPVLALSQLSRAPEQRPNHEPMLSDLRESGCLAGESMVYLPDLGTYRRIDELVGQTGFRVLALNETTWKLEPRPVMRAFSTGRKPVFRLTTRLGRNVRATANHKFRTIEGWKRLDELGPRARVALPRVLPGPRDANMSDAEPALLGNIIGDGTPELASKAAAPTVLPTRSPFLARDSLLTRTLVDRRGVLHTPQRVGGNLVRPERAYAIRPYGPLWHDASPSGERVHVHSHPAAGSCSGSGWEASTWDAETGTEPRATADGRRVAACPWHGESLCKENLTSDQATRYVHVAPCRARAETGVYWDEVESIVPDGETDVYDLTVEALHSFVCSDIILHNSIEQDADLVMFIYRDVVYNKETERPHVADVIVAKHRNGPTGKIHLFFQESLMKFLDLSVRDDV